MNENVMRIILCTLLSITSLGTAIAQEKPRVRTASESEIREAIRERGKSDQPKNKSERTRPELGYKISDGKICFLKGGKYDCLSVYSDGKRLEIVDRRGNREFLN